MKQSESDVLDSERKVSPSKSSEFRLPCKSCCVISSLSTVANTLWQQ